MLTSLQFLYKQKRKNSDSDEDDNIPENVYVEQTDDDGNDFPEEDNANDDPSVEMQSVRTSKSRRSIKSAFSGAGMSLKSKFSRRSRSGNIGGENDVVAVGDYQAPDADEGGFENDDTIATKEEVEDVGVVV